ncbi:HD domain-containing protein [soil metagenome]
MSTINAEFIADELISLYALYGNEDYIGEPVSQAEHMSQSAQFAIDEGYDEEVILAAFFHDVGHLLEHEMDVDYMDGYGIADHEKIGAEYLLSKGFSERIARLVTSHVNAKRYLTYLNPEYYEQLSDASKKTLVYQGGIMTTEEASDFEGGNDFELFIKLRSWDEAAKRENIPLVKFFVIKDMIIRHLNR